ncbi:Uncharacterised protein [Enterobacter kobei]|nr:Uncharacterised protein [Enterobacter kobei]SAC96221.1 Uncharacterised protein [Enterobacter kobei]
MKLCMIIVVNAFVLAGCVTLTQPKQQRRNPLTLTN